VVELKPPAAVLDIAQRLQSHGHQAWAVGGAVRDALLDRHGDDWDLATDALPETVRRIFRRTFPIGIAHGTVGVLGSDRVLYEVTTFRRDVETFGRHAVVAFAEHLEDDLARRDFTINAIAWNPLTGEIRDPYGGVQDLQGRTLRTVGNPAERFAEDYLRVLRALRFAGHFQLVVESETWQALKDAVPQLGMLSAERVREELWKVLSKTRAASTTLRLYADAGVLSQLFPELAATVGIDVAGARDAWDISLAGVDAIPPRRTLLRVAALLHALGYPGARARDLRGGWRYTGHEAIGARHAEAVMRRLKASNVDIERVTELVRKQSDLFPPDAPPAGVRRWFLHVPPALVNDFFRLRIALWRAWPVAGGDRDLLERWRKAHAERLRHPILTLSGLAIDGHDLRDLGIEPGPRYSRILQHLLDCVIQQPALNTREQLLALVRQEQSI
jgi:tRNA nucleotidyltransferase/poly(A) polymerase